MLTPLLHMLTAAAAVLQAPQVTLPTGASVSGKFQTNGAGHQVQVFQGIPYAEPPVGDLRWKQTTLKPLTGALNATSHGSICYGDPKLDAASGQYPPSEDCLFLNVYAPAGATKDSKLPVMVWVHGGGFIAGAANPYDGSDLVGVAEQKAVVVTFNYRLSVFGFLSNEEILNQRTGANFGLRDQEIAFEWVQQYIEYFGGNPRDVTAFGESAGAMSIATHMLSREGKQQLFHKAVLQSGAFLAAQSTPSRSAQAKTTTQLATSVGCASSTSVLACLRSANAAVVFNASLPLSWGVTVDDVFLLDVPIRRLLDGKFSRIPTVIGANTDEGWLFTFGSTEASQFDAYVRANYPLTEAEYAKVVELYPAASFATPHHRVAEIFADVIFVCPSEMLSTVLSLSQPAYRYRFNYTSTEFGYPLVVHAKDLDYVFNRTASLPRDEPTNTTVGYFETFWTNFARFGSPNAPSPQQTSSSIAWPLFDAVGKQQLVLQPTLAVEQNGAYMPLHAERCAFWHAVDLRVATLVAQ